MPALLEYIRKLAEKYQETSRINDDILFEIPHDEGENDNENLRSIIVSLYLHSDSIVAISL